MLLLYIKISIFSIGYYAIVTLLLITHLHITHMITVSILNTKGGVGKTTLAVNISRALIMTGQKVLLIDSDPQGSARDWHANSNGELLNVIGIDRPTLDKDIRAVSYNYDWIIIDGAPHLSKMDIAAIKCSDIILVPVQPSPYDLWASSDLVNLIKERQAIADMKPKAAFIINGRIANTRIGRDMREALTEYNLPVFKSLTFQRVIYKNTAAYGSTVLDYDPDCEAAKEIRAITQELMEFSK
jgi:chromosome partitioning protein